MIGIHMPDTRAVRALFNLSLFTKKGSTPCQMFCPVPLLAYCNEFEFHDLSIAFCDVPVQAYTIDLLTLKTYSSIAVLVEFPSLQV